MNVKKALIFGFFTAFLILGIVSMQRAMPAAKEARIYKEIKVYSPYILEKKVGGLYIIDKRSGIKESPSSKEVFLRMDELEKTWGKEHFQVQNNELIITRENNQSDVKILIETEKEREFIKSFFGI